MNRDCAECGHDEFSHTWTRDNTPCGECGCMDYYPRVATLDKEQ